MVSWYQQICGNYHRYPAGTVKNSLRDFSPEVGFEYRMPEKDDPKNEFRFECNECIYQKILGKRGLMKLGAMCCHADIINYGSLPYTDFIRTQTLCQGGDLCDFRFVRHKTDAGDGWERSKSI